MFACKIGSESGTAEYNGIISESENNVDKLTIYIVPKLNDQGNSKIQEGTTISFRLKATTVGKYQKTLYARFQIKVKGIEYTVEDIEYGNYATLTVRNTTREVATVSVEIPADELRMDMTDVIIGNTDQYETTYETTNVSGKQCVRKITFKMQPESSKNLNYYKVDKSQNYKNSIQKFTVKLK